VFVELDADESTRAWIDAVHAKPNPRSKILLRNLAMLFVNLYDANGLTNSFQDRLLSTAQWQCLLGKGGARLLDVGAGDGEVTRQLAPLFTDVVTTEVSKPMVRRLREKGYRSHHCDIAFAGIDDPGGFDVVALQNVIDRTTHPLRLIESAFELLGEDGRVVIATPLPLQPEVYAGSRRLMPDELLPVDTPDFESAVTALYEQVLAPRGYCVTAFTRAPYLCSGSAKEPLEVLDDAIFVLAQW
jgi:SAM-dependent methyltransferase